MKYLLPLLLLLTEGLIAQKSNIADLDSFVSEVFSKTRIAGASVLVAEKGKIILNKGYGFAHVGLSVKADSNTKYNLIGPAMIILGAAILQQVEKGKMSLDDEVSRYLKAFPKKGKKLKIRHLLSSTSGLVDYHYLGDPIESINHAMQLDEIIQLFAGRELLIEPGSQFDWSASNWALLVAILESSSGQPFNEYLKKNIFSPASASHIELYNPNRLISNHAQGYKLFDSSLAFATESMLRYDPLFHFIGTAADLHKIWAGMKDGKLLSAGSFQLMIDSAEARKNNSAHFRYAIASRQEQWGTAYGFRGGMPGYSTYFAYFPATDITIIVLANTSPQLAFEIGRPLERYIHGFPVPPLDQQIIPKVELVTITQTDREHWSGTYRVNRVPALKSAPKSFLLYERTFRIFPAQEELMFQLKGEQPQKLVKTSEGTYLLENRRDLFIHFTKTKKSVEVKIVYKNSDIDIGERVGTSDAKTFYVNVR